MRRKGMTLPAVIRIFFAIQLSQTLKQNLEHFIIALKKNSKSHAIRWTKPDNLHITLQFLAEVQREHLPLLLVEVRKKLRKKSFSFRLKIGDVQVFPHPYRPRVIVLDVHPQAILTALSTDIGKGIQAAHYQIEDRPFRGHLTLGRIKHAQNLNLHFLAEVPVPVLEEFCVTEVVLFRSEPQEHGSQYTLLETIDLKESSS
jgi:2'-5' RNA ligase